MNDNNFNHVCTLRQHNENNGKNSKNSYNRYENNSKPIDLFFNLSITDIFSNELKIWAVKNKVTHVAINDLVNILVQCLDLIKFVKMLEHY